MSEIIELVQLPVIDERLQALKAEWEQKTATAIMLECSEENKQEIKKIRTALTKEFNGLEERRKSVKKAILAEYEAFEKVYKECVTLPYKAADGALKDKIDAVEAEQKKDKYNSVERYAKELIIANGLSWLSSGRIMPKVTLTASEKALKEQVKQTVENIALEVKVIGEDVELLAEYQKTLSLATAKITISERHKAIEAAKQTAEQKAKQDEQLFQAEERAEMLMPPVVAEEAQKEEQKVTTSFKVRGTITQLKALKAYMQENNIEIIGGNT
ncbi:MAG: DUF1351 domain-containing protein [Clostridia bacterium]|nr:DUF1351 domain-containing protein [Clostridia bacterium]